MPVDKQKVLRFQVLNECFRNIHREYTIDDLVEVCNKTIEQKLDMRGISKRTIQSDINELGLPPYNIKLDETLRIGRKRIYRYEDPSFSLNLVQLSDLERNRIEEAIAVLENYIDNPQISWIKFCLQNIISDSFTDKCNNYIAFQNNPYLYGIEHFELILKSIANKQPLNIKYKPYPRKENGLIVDTKECELHIYPYLLKQFNDRWFLIGKQQNSKRISIYALDRIISIDLIHIQYEESGIDFEEYFDNTIGISVNKEISDVILRIKRERYPYIKTKPLHWSQTELKELCSDEYCTIKIKVCINKELITQILSFGEDIEVMEPIELRIEIHDKISKMLEHYNERK